MRSASLKKNIILFLFGIALCIVFLEIVPRIGDFIFLSFRDFRNKASFNKNRDKLKEAIRLNPQDGGAYASLGHFYNSHNRYSESEEMFKKAIEIEPNSYSVAA